MDPKELRRLGEMFMAEFSRVTAKDEKERCIMIALDLAELSLKQAKSFGLALLKGDPHEGGTVKQALEQMFPSVAAKLGK